MEDLSREDRERLERFLEWERASRRAARHRRRRHVSVAALVGVVFLAVVTWLAYRVGGNIPAGMATAPDRRPAEQARAESNANPVGTTESRPPTAAEDTPAAAAAARETVAPPAAAIALPPRTAVESARESPAGRDSAKEEPGARSDRPGVATPPTARSRTATDGPRRPTSPPGVDPKSAEQRNVAVKSTTRPAPAARSVAIPVETPVPPRNPTPNVTQSIPDKATAPTGPRTVAPGRGAPGPPAAAAPLPSAPTVAPVPPSMTPVAPPPPPAPPVASPPRIARQPDVANSSTTDRLDTLKRWVGYIPEVRIGKAIVRWVKSQPAVEPPPPVDPIQTQAR